MMCFILRLKKSCFKRRDGMGLMEAIILIIVVAFTVGAMLQTAFVTTKLQMAGRKYIESHKSMVSFFQTLESIAPGDIKNISTDILPNVKQVNQVGETSYLSISKPEVTVGNDVITVKITVTDSDYNERVIYKYYNIFSNRTVSDDRIKKI